MAAAPARVRPTTSRASTARSQGPAPNRASLAGSRATTRSAGLTAAPCPRSPRSKRNQSSAVWPPPPAARTTLATRLAASPITAAGSARRGIGGLLTDGRAQALGRCAVEVAEDPRVVRGQQSVDALCPESLEQPLGRRAQRGGLAD